MRNERAWCKWRRTKKEENDKGRALRAKASPIILFCIVVFFCIDFSHCQWMVWVALIGSRRFTLKIFLFALEISENLWRNWRLSTSPTIVHNRPKQICCLCSCEGAMVERCSCYCTGVQFWCIPSCLQSTNNTFYDDIRRITLLMLPNGISRDFKGFINILILANFFVKGCFICWLK